jgi:hypothetical protein
MEPVGGDAWHNGPAIWKVAYEYADSNGGGEAFDYFKTANRRTPPTGAGVEDCVASDEMTLLGIEGIEFYWVDGLDEPDKEGPPLEETKHGRLFDLTADTQGAGGRLEVQE